MINFDKSKCEGCGICVMACPQGVIEIKDKKATIRNYTSCMECGACQMNCDYNTIELTKGTGCLYAVLKEDILKIAPKGTGCCGTIEDGKQKGGGCC